MKIAMMSAVFTCALAAAIHLLLTEQKFTLECEQG